MKEYPHHYSAKASGNPEGSIELSAEGLPSLSSAPPIEFDGPGDQWSPETLLLAAVGDCMVLTFRAIARASRFEWESLGCRVDGTLDRADGIARFVALTIHAELRIADSARADTAQRLLEKAKRGCLITNSLTAPVELKASVSGP